MGKHDANYKGESSSYLDGANAVKKEGLWIVRNFKTILAVALIPAVGFGAYYLTQYLNNKKNWVYKAQFNCLVIKIAFLLVVRCLIFFNYCIDLIF